MCLGCDKSDSDFAIAFIKKKNLISWIWRQAYISLKLFSNRIWNSNTLKLHVVHVEQKQTTRSIQRTQTPPYQWPLTYDRDLMSRPTTLTSSYLHYSGVPCYQVWSMWVWIVRIIAICLDFISFDLDLWPWPLKSVKINITWFIKLPIWSCSLVQSNNVCGLDAFSR